MGKALGASGIASGDTVYLAPGTYREVNTVNMTSATAETKVIGDVANAQGFKNGSGVLLTPGPVYVTAWLTDDRTAPSATALLTLNARDYLTFQNLFLLAGANNCISAGAESHNIKIQDCVLRTLQSNPIAITGAADTALNWTIDRCWLSRGANTAIAFTLPTSASADYDVNVLIQNCVFLPGGNNNVIQIGASGANSFKAGGVDVVNCFQLGVGPFMVTNTANISTSIPNTVTNCWIESIGGTALNANTSGQITDNGYNMIWASTPRTNVTAHANSYSGNQIAPLYSLGHEAMWGMVPRPLGMPMAGSGMLGFSDYGSTPSVDLMNRARPEGGGSATSAASDTGTATAGAGSTLTDGGKSWTVNGYTGYIVKITGGTGSGQLRAIQSNTATVLTVTAAWGTTPDNTSTYSIDHPGKYYAVGAYERHDTFANETSTVYDGSYGWVGVGPSSYEFQLAVDPIATTVSVYARYDSTHAATNKPQMLVVNGSECGVADATATMAAAADTWEQLSLSFTPTGKGLIRVRWVSRAAAGNGKAFFDKWRVT